MIRIIKPKKTYNVKKRLGEIIWPISEKYYLNYGKIIA